jgi:hypothetical protein
MASFGILLVSHVDELARISKSTNTDLGCQRMPKVIKKQKTRISTGLEAGFWLFQDFLGHGIGGDRWT